MTLLVKDANTAVQSLSTVTDGNGAVARPFLDQCAGCCRAGRAAEPAAGRQHRRHRGKRRQRHPRRGRDGAEFVRRRGAGERFPRAEQFLGGLRISDTGAASTGGASIQIAPNGGLFATPSGYKPAGPVSLFGATTGQAFAARRW